MTLCSMHVCCYPTPHPAGSNSQNKAFLEDTNLELFAKIKISLI